MRCDGCNNYWGWSGKFQSTHLHEVWQNDGSQDNEIITFQSTHLHEVWRWKQCTRQESISFQSTHLHEVWQEALNALLLEEKFQSTHLHEVWLLNLFFKYLVPMFQSTHLHEVWLRCWYPPSWASWSFNPHTYMRCDLFAWIWGMVETSFNPHTYMRCDNRGKTVCWYDRVSIHTPTWGVTANSMNYKINQMFQSTHLHEVWPIWITEVSNDFQSFNPHTYMRCDSMFPVMFPLR